MGCSREERRSIGIISLRTCPSWQSPRTFVLDLCGLQFGIILTFGFANFEIFGFFHLQDPVSFSVLISAPGFGFPIGNTWNKKGGF